MGHAEFLRGEGADDLAVEQIKADWRQMDLTTAERAMLEYSEKLTLTPSAMTRDDLQRLREAGWTDRDILDITQVCAYFNYRTRMADALGVEIDPGTLVRAQAGALRAAEQAQAQGQGLPDDPWAVRRPAGVG